MSEFEKIKIAVNKNEYQTILSIYEGRTEFYQDVINKLKEEIPDITFDVADLVTIFNDPKTYLVEKNVPEPLTISGLELSKDKIFDLLSNSDQLNTVIAYIATLKQNTSPYESKKNLHIYSKDYEITKSEDDSYIVKLKESVKNNLEDQHSVYLKNQKQKDVYDASLLIREEIQKISGTYSISHIKVIEDFFEFNSHGDILAVNYKAIQRLG